MPKALHNHSITDLCHRDIYYPIMSNRRICVCGRERGRNPVIITITTCRHTHSPRNLDSFNISAPLATSSPINVTDASTEKSKKKNKSKVKKIGSKRWFFNKDKDKKDDTVGDQSAYKTANEGDSTVQSFRSADGTSAVTSYRTADGTMTRANDSTFNESTYQNDVTNFSRNDTTGSGYSADNSSRFQDSTLYDTGNDISLDSTKNNKKKNPTVMFLTETAINTMPFLDNLFWTKGTTSSKSMPNLSSEDCTSPENCSLEVFVFEKHSKQCRHFLSSEGITKNNSFFDGDTLFDTLGRISFPVRCDDFRASKSEKLASIYSQLKENFARTRDPLNTFDKFVKNKQFFTNLNSRSEPLNINLKKYITMGNDIYQKNFDITSSKTDIKELYFRKDTNDQSVQFEGFDSTSKITTKPPKWYNIFFMCFGARDHNDIIQNEVEIVREELARRSSLLITKYLRI